MQEVEQRMEQLPRDAGPGRGYMDVCISELDLEGRTPGQGAIQITKAEPGN